MGNRLKKLKDNNIGSTNVAYFGVLIAIIGFTISSTVFAHFIGWSEESPYTVADSDMLELLISTDYENMTSQERKAWLDYHYKDTAKCGWFDEWSIKWDFTPWSQKYYYWGDYGDGDVNAPTHIMSVEDYEDFLSGDYDYTTEIDSFAILGDIMTLNLPILNNLGVVGVGIKLLIGILVAFIIYLLLPFTG